MRGVLYAVERKIDGQWTASEGGVFALKSSALRHMGWMRKHFVGMPFRIRTYRRVTRGL